MHPDIPALLREMSACYHQAIAILDSQGITRDNPDWGDRLASQIKALSCSKDKAA